MPTALHFVPGSATSLEEVVDQLTKVIDWSVAEGSRIGYFAALYRKVTVAVARGIADGDFDDGRRMERLDVIFANRYLEALAARQQGRPTARVWELAFSSAGEWSPIVLQHLLLGMNAHINLDLGIAAADTMKDVALEPLRNDFNKINAVLASLVDEVQRELAEVWTLLRVMNRLLGSVDDQIVRFSMDRARDEAWRSAERFWDLRRADREAEMGRQDLRALGIGRLVRHPGYLLGAVTRVVRVGEVRDVARVIGLLSGNGASVSVG